MPSILEECTTMTARLDALEQRETLQLDAEAIEQRRHELEQLQLALSSDLGRALTLVGDGCMTRDQLPEASGIRELFTNVRERLSKDPSQLAKGRDYKKLLASLASLRAALADLVERAWTRKRDAADPVDLRLLDHLEQIPGQEPAVARIRALRGRLRELGGHPPGDNASLNDFNRVAAELATAWTDIDLGDLPESVVEFFRQARSRAGAPASAWTEDVRNWLERHDMLGSVRLHFGKI